MSTELTDAQLACAEAEHWHPDELLIAAVLAGSRTTMSDLRPADRAWTVVGLREAGHTAESIADRLACSLRLVRSIAADDLGQVVRLLHQLSETFDREQRMAASEVRRLAIALREAERDRDRYSDQLARLLDRMLVGEGGPTFRCGHAKTKYNTYTAPKTGKTSCRQCHADAQARYEARKAERVEVAATG